MSTTSEREKAPPEPFRATVVAVAAAPWLDELGLASAADAAVVAGDLHRARQLLAALTSRLECRVRRERAAKPL